VYRSFLAIAVWNIISGLTVYCSTVELRGPTRPMLCQIPVKYELGEMKGDR
jgi:hypothetical protein